VEQAESNDFHPVMSMQILCSLYLSGRAAHHQWLGELANVNAV
jgi:hypothetical protein